MRTKESLEVSPPARAAVAIRTSCWACPSPLPAFFFLSFSSLVLLDAPLPLEEVVVFLPLFGLSMITSLSASLLSDSMVISACFLPLLLEELDAVEAPLALDEDEEAAARDDDFAGESVAVERFFALGADCPAVLSALRFGACVQSSTGSAGLWSGVRRVRPHEDGRERESTPCWKRRRCGERERRDLEAACLSERVGVLALPLRVRGARSEAKRNVNLNS